METIKDRVVRLCVKRGFSLAQLEKALDFGNGTIGRWDVSTPRADKLAAVATYLNVPVEYLRTGELPKQKESPVTVTSDEAIEDTVELAKKAYFNSLFDRASPALRDKIIGILLQELQNQ